MQVSVRIQHHPSRAELIPDLLERLAPLPTEVIEHASDPPSPWGGYQVCLTDPPDCQHLLVIQDDGRPVPGFAEAVEQISDTHPDKVVVLFLARLPRDASMRAMRAMKMKRRYVLLPYRNFLPVVAVMWPPAKAIEFMDWARENPKLYGHAVPRSDDAMAGRWKLATRQQVYATVPSLVQHPDEVDSTVGRLAHWGRDKTRVACLLADDASEYDWSLP